MHQNKILAFALICSISFVAVAAPSLNELKKEGARDGARYAQDSRDNGIEVDRVVCIVGMSAEDNSRPELSQAEIEAYAAAFGNACMGRKVF